MGALAGKQMPSRSPASLSNVTGSSRARLGLSTTLWEGTTHIQVAGVDREAHEDYGSLRASKLLLIVRYLIARNTDGQPSGFDYKMKQD